MKELDVVKLTQDYENIPSGTEGTIVCEYDGKAFEVEFFDANGDTLDVVTTPAELLELVEDFEFMTQKENGKLYCSRCGQEIISIIEGHSLILTCSEHGGRIATTYFSDMELDSTNYEIFLKPNNIVNKDNIKIISKISNLNFLESKKLLESKTAVSIYKVKDEAVREISKPEEIIKVARKLKELSLDFYITPEFKYEI